MQGVRTTISCTSCKRRKKGCDFQKPTCGRCLKAGERCVYENRLWHFIDASEPARTRGKRSSSSGSPTALAPPSALGPFSQACLHNTDLRLQIGAAFWDVYLPADWNGCNNGFGDVFSAPWLTYSRRLAMADTLTRLALDAVTMTGLGWWRADSTLVQRGIQHYGLALRRANEALQDPEKAQSNDLLTTCRLLSLFEMFQRGAQNKPGLSSNQSLDWRKHAEGTYELVRMRGQALHQSEEGAAIYDGVRVTAVFQGIGVRQSNAFTKLTWKLPGKCSLRDQLYNLMALVPDLLENADVLQLLYQQELSPTDRQHLHEQGQVVLERFVTVGDAFRRWTSKALAMCRHEHLEDGSDPLFGASMLYGDGFYASCGQVWAVYITLFSTARQLWQAVDKVQPGSLLALPDWMDPEPYANYLALTCTHFFRPEAGLWGAQGAVFPLSQALFYFSVTGRGSSPQFQMLLDSFEQSKSGVIVADFLRSLMHRF